MFRNMAECIRIRILFGFRNLAEYIDEYYLECHFCPNTNTNTPIIQIIPNTNTNNTKTIESMKLRTVKIEHWVICHLWIQQKIWNFDFGWNLYYSVSKLQQNTNMKNNQVWNIMRIRIHICSVFKIHPNTIRIIFGLNISAKYEYHYSVQTIWILFEYWIIRSPLFWNWVQNFFEAFPRDGAKNLWFYGLFPHS